MADVKIQTQGPVMTLTLNRPETKNALDEGTLDGLVEAMGQAAKDQGIRAVIISGGPGRFCSGLNLKRVAGLAEADRRPFLDKVFAAFEAVYTSTKPVIAAIDGPALAGGFDLAVMCHIRFASSRAVFGQPEVLIGFTQLIDPLWKIIGLGRARELALTGRIYGADEALAMGLVSRVYPVEDLAEAALDLARELTQRSPEALAATLRMCNQIPGLPVDEALEAQGRVFLELFNRPQLQEMVQSFLRGLKK